MADRGLQVGGDILLVMEGTDIAADIVKNGGSKQSIVRGLVRTEATLFFVGTTRVMLNSFAIGGTVITSPLWGKAVGGALVVYGF